MSLAFAKKLRFIVPTARIVYTTVKAKQLFFPSRQSSSIVCRYNIIYRNTCPSCSCTYIGRTRRLFFHRGNEHTKSFIGEHHHHCGNSVEFINCFKVLDQAITYKDLCILEALYIQFYKPSLNTQLSNNGCEHVLALKLF